MHIYTHSTVYSPPSAYAATLHGQFFGGHTHTHSWLRWPLANTKQQELIIPVLAQTRLCTHPWIKTHRSCNSYTTTAYLLSYI